MDSVGLESTHQSNDSWAWFLYTELRIERLLWMIGMENRGSRVKQVLPSLVLLLGMGGCSENPLIGEWVIADKSRAKSGLVCKAMEFTKEREICDGIVMGVKYEVRKGAVIVEQSAETPLFDVGISTNVHSKDSISYVDPFTGKNIRYRRKGTVPFSDSVALLMRSYSKDELQKSCDEGMKGVLKYDNVKNPQAILDSVCLAAKMK